MDSNTIIAICALVVSVVATGLSILSGCTQWKHMKLSVRPLAEFSVGDYEDRIGVWLDNKGLGPMKITNFQVISSCGKVCDDIVSHMPDLAGDTCWSNFRSNLIGRAIQNGKRFELILLEGDPSLAEFRKSREMVRLALKDLTLALDYADLYGKSMKRVEYKLSWFGRHGI